MESCSVILKRMDKDLFQIPYPHWNPVVVVEKMKDSKVGKRRFQCPESFKEGKVERAMEDRNLTREEGERLVTLMWDERDVAEKKSYITAEKHLPVLRMLSI